MFLKVKCLNVVHSNGLKSFWNKDIVINTDNITLYCEGAIEDCTLVELCNSIDTYEICIPASKLDEILKCRNVEG